MRPLVLLTAASLGLSGVAACGGEGHASTTNGASTNGAATNGAATNAVVVRVVDGDTVDVRIAGRRERVRLIGVNTPESVGDRPHECFGKEASAFTAGLLPVGTPVLVERDAEPRDDYGRLLGYLHRADGLFINLELAAEGYAEVLTIAPNVAHVDELQDAVASARNEARGLWSACGSAHVTLPP